MSSRYLSLHVVYQCANIVPVVSTRDNIFLSHACRVQTGEIPRVLCMASFPCCLHRNILLNVDLHINDIIHNRATQSYYSYETTGALSCITK